MLGLMNNIMQTYKTHWHSVFFPMSSRSVVWFSVFVILAFSILDLTGWIFDIDLFKSINPAWEPMTVPAAVCFSTTALTLLVILTGKPAGYRKIIPYLSGALLILAGISTLLVRIPIPINGKESSLTYAPVLSLFFGPETRMPVLSGILFLLIGTILILLTKNNPRTSNYSHILLFPAFIISYLIPVNYLIGGNSFNVVHDIGDALNSGIAFCLTSTAILFIRPDSWLMTVFSSKNSGGRMARKLLPPLLALPLVIGWFRITGEKSGLFESEEGVALVAMVYTICFILLVWLSARSVNKTDKNLLSEITEHKKTEEALRKSESQVRLKLKSILSPEGKIDKLELSDIIDVGEIQIMMDNFYRFAKTPMAIIDLKGKVLVAVGWQEICSRFHRVHPETSKNCLESDLQLTAEIPQGEFKLYRCKNGMWDMATPIYIGDQQMGNLFLGQFFFDNDHIDFNRFRAQALKYNFDPVVYIDALRKVPLLHKEDIESAKIFFVKLANALSQLSYSIIQLSRSISEIEESERLLMENKAHLERSQQIAHLGSWELNLIENKLTWSDEVYRIFGLTPGEFKATYEAFLEAVHPEDRIAVDNAYTGSLKEKRDTYEIEHRVVRNHTGEIRYVHEKCEHFRDSSGKIIRSVGMVHDITDQKRAEIEVNESKDKLNIALDSGNIGIWEWNFSDDEMIIDERMEVMLGLKPGTFGGSYRDFENLLNEEDISHFKSSISKAMNENTSFETIFRVRIEKNEYKYINAKASVLNDHFGNPVKMSGVCFDITGMKKGTEQALFDLNEELLRSNNELEQFAYVASHDLQEPLRMVSSFIQLISSRYKDKLDKDANDYINYAVEGASRMQTQINDLLTLSRIQTRGLEFSVVSMNSVLEQVLKNLKARIDEKKAILTSGELGYVFGDHLQMIQLLQNLIGNSIKYSRENPDVHISFKEEGKYNIYSVKDNGIGIEPQYIDRIFKIFTRLHSRGDYEGNGIGLAICKRIVIRHKGNIWVESEPGKGSTFYFTIPIN